MKIDIGECLLQGWTSGSDESDLFLLFGSRVVQCHNYQPVSLISTDRPVHYKQQQQHQP